MVTAMTRTARRVPMGRLSSRMGSVQVMVVVVRRRVRSIRCQGPAGPVIAHLANRILGAAPAVCVLVHHRIVRVTAVD